MKPFWIASATLWTLLFLYVVAGAWSAASRKEIRRNDPMRLATAATAVMMAGFSYRWLLVPTSEVTWQALYVLSAFNALYLGFLTRAYGRGPKL